MAGGNGTAVIEFVLLGFSGFGSLPGPLFWGGLCIYLVTLLGNSLIILLTLADPALNSPMYFFLRHFSVVEILYTTTIMPRMLADLLASCPTISPASCFTQLYFFALFGITECCLLTAMACDRYAAICRPLHYTTLMNQGACVSMVAASYLMGIITGTTHSIFIFTLPFCGANTIHHFLCDILPVLRLASASTFWGEVGNLALAIAFILTPFLLIIASYGCILATILGIATSQGCRKVLYLFSTCSSHLFVVMIFFGTGTVAYMRPWAGSSQDMDSSTQILAFVYTVVTPMFNPFVYTLRNKEVTGAMKRLVKRYIWSP
ncbi:LOW QUALITY PROTEIN: olfactory receptor 9-like [Lutra lutra]|uniref:LOW QUALITY PROTEIN: olfactory receptor 9-like n=1 Tax=Lutra lutra TaxID=9657 RepID=UPI001FD5DA0D|nr:LOW QUALITY PROTEIN: olfactory receptor 9-like [Lutra lutra]